MNRTLKCLAVAGALAAVTFFVGAQDVYAGWGGGSWGSYGGSSGWSYGSWGSYGGSYGGGGYGGGSYGGWGSHGGPIRRLFHHHHWHHSHSWGSSGGYGSSGGWGSSGGHGSNGGSYYLDKDSMPMDAAPDTDAPPPPEAPGENGTLPEPGTEGTDTNPTGSAMLNVTVPEGASVFVNGRATTSTGARRQFVSRGLTNGFSYTYEVRAEATINGQKVQDTKIVRLHAGDDVDVAFDLTARPETSLTLHVPADAKVTLAGNETAASGDVRVFRTTSLADGEEWSNYVVRVSIERDGSTLEKEETISLKAGESRELNFDFDGAQVASAR